ncbi:MAG: 3-deoxy-7-phosphoheptulonate synthase [Myxococcota bacterium]
MTTVITLRSDADAKAVQAALQGLGVWAKPLRAADGRTTALGLDRCSRRVAPAELRALSGVEAVLGADSPHPRLDAAAGRAVRVGEGADAVLVGGGASAVLAAGPCAAEDEEQVHAAARMAAEAGARLLRGGAWKPRTSPYSFSGHGGPALRWLREAADAHGLHLVTEVLAERDVDGVAEAAEVLQIGSRNMQNFALLHAAGRTGRPVLLKRGRAATLDEWRLAAEHLLDAGAGGVILCERGVRGPDPETRNLLDLAAVALLVHVDGLPVLVDPSHAVGRRDLVAPLARAALAAGASGLLVEAHPDATRARSDGPQALSPSELRRIGAMTTAEVTP